MMQAQMTEPLKFYSIYELETGYQYRVAKENKLFNHKSFGNDPSKSLKNALVERNKILKKSLPKGMGINLFHKDSFSVSEKTHYYQCSVRVLLTRKVYYISLPKSKFTRKQAEVHLYKAYRKWFAMHNTIAATYNKIVSKAFNAELDLELKELKPHVTIRKFQPELWQTIALETFPNLAHEHYVSDEINDYLSSLKDNGQGKLQSEKKKNAHILEFKNLPFYGEMNKEQCSAEQSYTFKSVENGTEVKKGSFTVSADSLRMYFNLGFRKFNKTFRWYINETDTGGCSVRFHMHRGVRINGNSLIDIESVDDLNVSIEAIATVLMTANQFELKRHEDFLPKFNLNTKQNCRDAAIYLSIYGILKALNNRGLEDNFKDLFASTTAIEDGKIFSSYGNGFELPKYIKECSDYTDLKKTIVCINNVLPFMDKESSKEHSDDMLYTFNISVKALKADSEKEQQLLELAKLDTDTQQKEEVKVSKVDYLNQLTETEILNDEISIHLNLDPKSDGFLECSLQGKFLSKLPTISFDYKTSLCSQKEVEIHARRFSLANSVHKYHCNRTENQELQNKSFSGYSVQACSSFYRAIAREIDEYYDHDFIASTLDYLVQNGSVIVTKNYLKLTGFDHAVFRKDALGSRLIVLSSFKFSVASNPHSYIELSDSYREKDAFKNAEDSFLSLSRKVFEDRSANYPMASRRFIVDKFPDQLYVPLCSCCGSEPNISLNKISEIHYLNIYCDNDCFPAKASSGLLRKDLHKPVMSWLKDNINTVYFDEVSDFEISKVYGERGLNGVKVMLEQTLKLLQDIYKLIQLKDDLNSREDNNFTHYLKTPYIKSNIIQSIELCEFYIEVSLW